MLHLCFNVEVSKRKFWAITSSFDRISLSLWVAGCAGRWRTVVVSKMS